MKDGRDPHLLYKAEHVVDLEAKVVWRLPIIMAMKRTSIRWLIVYGMP